MMKVRYKFGVLTGVFATIVAVMFSSMFTSCGKDSAASPTGLNTQLNILNLSPDIYPINFFINLRQQNTKSYIYGVPSNYFYITSLATPVQLRTLTNITIFNKNDSLRANTKYSLFVTGTLADKTDTVLFTVDTDRIPSVGKAKVRFINTSAKSAAVDMFANGTLTSDFKNIGFCKMTKYIEMPAGIYDFKIYGTGTSTVYADLPNTTVQDGRLYTVYTRGIIGRTDSAAYAASIITNR